MNLERTLKCCLYVAVSLLALSLAGFAVSLSYQATVGANRAGQAVATRVDAYAAAIGDRLNARDKQVDQALQKLDAALGNVNDMVTDTYHYNVASADAAKDLMHDASEIVHEIKIKTLPDVNDILTTSKVLLHGMQADLDEISGKVGTNLDTLNGAIANASMLIATANTELKEDNPHLLQTVDGLNTSLGDIHKILSDPNNAKLMANVEGTSESLNTIMARMATKVGLLKTILGVLADMVKVNLTGPRIW